MGTKSSSKDKAATKKAEKKKKVELKTEKSIKKKLAKELDGEEQIETTIARIEKEARKKSQTSFSIMTACNQPGPRSNFSIVQSPLSDDVLVFGGQYFDGQTQFVYGDLLRWNFARNEWRQVEASLSPSPRSCHQAVVHKHHMYVFGGEYSTIKQFHHFRDLWRFDLKTNTWTEIKASGPSPSPRSGHRMIVWKHYIVIFGGFHDTFRDCKYFNDLYLFNISEEKWESIDLSNISVPSPRSGCGFFIHPTNDLAFVHGGYVRDKKVSGTELTDMWQLSLRLQPGTAVPVKGVWERISRKGTPPSRRSGASFAVHKSRALVFGGVFDKDTQGLTMDSEFFNELYAFDMDRKRWYVLDYNAPKIGKDRKRHSQKTHQQFDQIKNTNEPEDADDEVTKLEKFQWIFEYVDEHGNPAQMIVDDGPSVPSPEVEEPFQTAPEMKEDVVIPVETVTPQVKSTTSIELELPSERMGAAMFVVGNTLAVFGGIAEVNDKEITYDDCWTLDLNARDRWNRKLEGTMERQVWLGDDEDDDDDADEFDDEEDSCSSIGEDESDWTGSEDNDSDAEMQAKVVAPVKKGKLSLKEKMDRIRSDHDLTETYTPLVGESLKDFYKRTQIYWSEKVATDSTETDRKEIRRLGFGLAEARFEATAGILAKLKEFEEEQSQLETTASNRNSTRTK